METIVSVIVATYHREDALKKALISLGAQSYQSLEIVLVDDNANSEWNKKVQGIVEEFRMQFPNTELTYICNEENLGSAKTRNKGIERAKGVYITFLDDDDIYLPNKVENQLRFMQEEQLDYSITDLDLYYDNGKLAEHKTRTYIKRKDPKSLFVYHLMYHITGTDTMMFTKEYLKKIGGFAPIDVGDEFYLIQRAIEHEGNFGYLPICDVQAIIHTTDEGLSSGEGKIKGAKQLYLHKKKYFKQIGLKHRRYIRMRHYAVLAFAEKRRGKIVAFFLNGIRSAMCAPIACIKLLLGRSGL